MVLDHEIGVRTSLPPQRRLGMPKRANRHDGSSRSTFALKYPRYPPMKLFNVPPNSRPAVSQQSRSRSFHLRYAFQNLTAPRALVSVPPEGDAAEAKAFNPSVRPSRRIAACPHQQVLPSSLLSSPLMTYRGKHPQSVGGELLCGQTSDEIH